MAPNPTLPSGSIILVTGVNGFIAAHVAQQFMRRGYKVRGTVRSLSKSEWLVKDLFATEALNGSFEMVEIKNMAQEGSFDDVVKGVAGIAHVATVTSLDPDPKNVVPPTVAGVVNLLDAATKEPSVKEFVFTSTYASAVMPVPDTSFHVDASSWNEMAVSIANAPPPFGPERPMLVYMASKVEAEKAFWRFVEDKKPHFTANTVLPVTVFGDLLHEKQNPSTAGWAFGLYKGDTRVTSMIKALNHVHVQDVALMHVATMLDPSVKNDRIYAESRACTWNDILGLFKKLRPHEKFIEPLADQGNMLGTIDDVVGRRLLKDWAGRKAWLALETEIRDNLDGKWPLM